MKNTNPKIVITGEYGRHGYTIMRTRNGQTNYLYDGGNCDEDSHAVADPGFELPLSTIRSYCIKTGREFAQELGGVWGGAKRVEIEKAST